MTKIDWLSVRKENSCLNLYLGDLKAPWEDLCKGLGQKPGAVLKDFIKHRINHFEAKPYRQTEQPFKREKKQRFEILLTPSEKAALEISAQHEHCSKRRWVIHAIRAGLTHQAQFNMKEIETLGESNYQLLLIGRSLKQIAKAIHLGHRPTATQAMIEKLSHIIDQHTQQVSLATRASLERWDLK